MLGCRIQNIKLMARLPMIYQASGPQHRYYKKDPNTTRYQNPKCAVVDSYIKQDVKLEAVQSNPDTTHELDTTDLFKAMSELYRYNVKLPSFPRLFSIGNQSSGKSSVLNSIIGGHGLLPTKMGVSTMKPLNLTTIKSDVTMFKIGDVKYYDEEEARLEVERQNANHHVKVVDILVYSPNVCNIFMTDLPGLFSVADESDPELPTKIEQMNEEFLKDNNNIPVLISEAPVDPANNLALKIIGSRRSDAIGIITKTDMTVRQSMQIVRGMLDGTKYPLGGGWVAVVLRNKSEVDARMTVEDKIKEENDFFTKYSNLKPSGVETMRRMISNAQFNKLKNCIPKLITDIDNTILTLEQSKNTFGNLMHDPNKTLPAKISVLITKLVDSSSERSEFQAQLERRFNEKINSYIHTVTKDVDIKRMESSANVDYSLLHYINKNYPENPKIDDTMQEMFNHGLVAPVVVDNDTVSDAFKNECGILCSIGMFEPYTNDPLGRKRLKWYRQHQAFFNALTNNNNIQELVFNITEDMMLEYIQNDPDIRNDETSIKFVEYMIKEIGNKIYNEKIQFAIVSMINAEKHPDIKMSTIYEQIIKTHPEYVKISKGIFGQVSTKKKPIIETYGDEWNMAYIQVVSNRIAYNCYKQVVVCLINPMISNILQKSFEMCDKHQIHLEENKITNKLEKLRELRANIEKYNIN